MKQEIILSNALATASCPAMDAGLPSPVFFEPVMA
jgi:hypothetical protein